MAAWPRAIELVQGEEDTAKSISIAQSPTESASRVERARILPTFCKGPKMQSLSRTLKIHLT
jgi:hypothetical protein